MALRLLLQVPQLLLWKESFIRLLEMGSSILLERIKSLYSKLIQIQKTAISIEVAV